MTNIPVPAGLHEMLQGFVVSVLRNQPADVKVYAAQYFSNLMEDREQIRETRASAGHLPVPRDEDKSSSENEDFLNEEEERALMAKHVSVSRRKSVCGERINEDEVENDDVNVVHPKSDEQRERLSKVVRNMLIFKSLDTVQLQCVLDAMFERVVTAGEHVIDEGDGGDNFYVVERGDYDIFIKDPLTQAPVHKGAYKGAGAFGELALMYNCPRAATIIATTDGALWAMDRLTFRKIIVKNGARKRKQYEDFLGTVPLLSTLTKLEIAKIADAMEAKTFDDGEVILQQGAAADYFYILIEGFVVVKRRGDDPSAPDREVQLKRYKTGEYFGELALITSQARAATAVADGPCTCAVLDVQAFERLLGPCKDLLARNIPLYEQQLREIYNVLPPDDA